MRPTSTKKKTQHELSRTKAAFFPFSLVKAKLSPAAVCVCVFVCVCLVPHTHLNTLTVTSLFRCVYMCAYITASKAMNFPVPVFATAVSTFSLAQFQTLRLHIFQRTAQKKRVGWASHCSSVSFSLLGNTLGLRLPLQPKRLHADRKLH